MMIIIITIIIVIIIIICGLPDEDFSRPPHFQKQEYFLGLSLHGYLPPREDRFLHKGLLLDWLIFLLVNNDGSFTRV